MWFMSINPNKIIMTLYIVRAKPKNDLSGSDKMHMSIMTINSPVAIGGNK
jgi:hypothetical protein